jgi:hypothetical protein
MSTIVFVDEGQDFLEWDINDKGIITACRPFQGWVWVGTKVKNKEIKPGDKLDIITKNREFQLRHPVDKVFSSPDVCELDRFVEKIVKPAIAREDAKHSH